MCNKRKIEALFTAIALVIGLTACGSGSDTGNEGNTGDSDNTTSVTDGDSGEDTADTQQAENNDEAVTLTVWCWDPNYNINALRVAEEIYQREHPNFSLEILERNSQETMEKLATTTTSGTMDELPDIMLFDDSIVKQQLLSYPDAFADLTDLGFNYGEFSDSKVAYSVVDGRNYGIPFDSGTALAFYRTDILEEAGYTIDDFTDITWDEFIEKGKVVLEKTGHPLLNGLSSYNQVTIMLASAGSGYFDEAGNLDMVDNEAIKEIMRVYIEMVETGVYEEETGWDMYLGNINNGTVAGAMNGCWMMASLQAAEDQSGLWAVTNLPKLGNVANATNYSSQGGSTWVVSSNCAYPQEAVDFFKSTFGGSTELYDRILPTGAIATWLPAANSEKYEEPVEFFSNQAVFSLITQYSAEVPIGITNAYDAIANNAVVNAITNVLYSGGTIDEELEAAEEMVRFSMDV